MVCTTVQLQLSRFSADTLPEHEARAVEAHLNECDGCWSAFVALQGEEFGPGDEVLAELPHAHPEPLRADFTAQVMARVEAERPTGINVVWPWLRQRWSRRQYTSAAYAMSATVAVFSASSFLSLWTESTTLLTVWGVKLAAYRDAFSAYLGIPGSYLSSLWESLTSLIGGN